MHFYRTFHIIPGVPEQFAVICKCSYNRNVRRAAINFQALSDHNLQCDNCQVVCFLDIFLQINVGQDTVKTCTLQILIIHRCRKGLHMLFTPK